MMQAVNVFGAQVKKCEAAIRSAHASNLELLTATQGAMAVPLPQAYQGVASGSAATPTSVALDLVGGTGADVQGVSRAGNEAGHKLETEVLAPLSRWQQVHRQLQVRLARLQRGGAGRGGKGAAWLEGAAGAATSSQPPASHRPPAATHRLRHTGAPQGAARHSA